jgi:hypothetical protein
MKMKSILCGVAVSVLAATASSSVSAGTKTQILYNKMASELTSAINAAAAGAYANPDARNDAIELAIRSALAGIYTHKAFSGLDHVRMAQYLVRVANSDGVARQSVGRGFAFFANKFGGAAAVDIATGIGNVGNATELGKFGMLYGNSHCINPSCD